LKRHEEEWCDAPKVVELRGLAMRSRKLRYYDRDWNLGEADDGSEVDYDDEDDEEEEEENDDEGDEEEEVVVAPSGVGGKGSDGEEGSEDEEEDGSDDDSKPRRKYISVRKDPFTLAKMGIKPVDLEKEAKESKEKAAANKKKITNVNTDNTALALEDTDNLEP
jgi:hypothetical protein